MRLGFDSVADLEGIEEPNTSLNPISGSSIKLPEKD
jgi:hypothetical protein